MFRYFARFYERYNLPISPIALCSYIRPRRQAADRHRIAVGEHEVLSFRYQVVQLNRIDWREYMRTENSAAVALMARMHIAPGERWRLKATCLRLVAGLPLTIDRRRVISRFVDLYLPLAAHEERAVIDELHDLTPTQRAALLEFANRTDLNAWLKQQGDAPAAPEAE